MLNGKVSSQADKKYLLNVFDGLKRKCAMVLKAIANGRYDLYVNYAEIYVWWREAAKVDGLVDSLTGHLKSLKLYNVNHGINFSPLLVVLFNNTLSDQERNRGSRLLNALHNEVTKNPELYRHDIVNKLAGYIKSVGGIIAATRLVNKKSKGDSDSRVEQQERELNEKSAEDSAVVAGLGIKYRVVKQSNEIKPKSVKEQDKVQALSKAAAEFWNDAKIDAKVSFNVPISVDKDNYANVLIKYVEGEGYQLVDINDDPKQTSVSRVNAFRKQFEAIPFSLRVLCETLRTQVEPWNMGGTKDIVEVNPDDTLKGEDSLARTRLLHLHKTNQLLLSQPHMKSGVVTLVRPFSPALEAVSYDVMMAPYSKRLAEARLIADDGFNMYEPKDAQKIPATKNNSFLFCHQLNVKSKVKGLKPFDLLFKSFESHSSKKSTQVNYLDAYDEQLTFNLEVPALILQAVTREFATPWTHDLGLNISHEKYNHIGLTFTESHLNFEHTVEKDEYTASKPIRYTEGTSKEELYSEAFLTKDLLPVLVAMGNLPIQGNVEIKGGADVLIFEFSTSAAAYFIAVPTFNVTKAHRSEAAFTQYVPQSRNLSAEEQEEQYIQSLSDSEADDYSEQGGLVHEDDNEILEATVYA